ncbi:MAG: mechanosensitive ion channel [Desulfovibrio sp.]|nr:mechanosensitive ion channel [Desulfovibrio sp.]
MNVVAMRATARFALFAVLLGLIYFATPARAEKVLPSVLLEPNAEADKNSGKKEPEAPKEEKTPQDEGLAKVNETWENIWSNQREMLNEIRETARSLGENFAVHSQKIEEQIQPFEDEARRLLVFAKTFKGYPNAMEAVARRIGATISQISQVLEPVSLDRDEAEGLLERINSMAVSLPQDADAARLSPEMQGYVNDIVKARIRLTGVIAQYDSLLPSLTLTKQLVDAQKSINEELPTLWKNYYLQKPIAWLSPSVWQDVSRNIVYNWRAIIMRLPVELPVTPPQWSTAVLRFFIGFIFAGALSLLLKKRWLEDDSPKAAKHIFNYSLPSLVLGFALVGSSMSATGDFYRAFLAIGCFCLILGQILLAWDIRLLQFPEQPFRRSPFLFFLPIVIGGYLLLFLPLTEPISLVLWSILMVLAIYRQKKRKTPTLVSMHIEAAFLECYPIILWLCLFLSVSGLHLYSILLYIIFFSLGVALEISFGGIALASRINERLPQEGIRAVIARLLVALAAPLILVLAVIGLFLWIAMLPGGTYLLNEYALKGITVGATQFNIVQALMIISVFYLTRTVVAMGTRFLAKLPEQGGNFDATLITPMQTALTYIAWAFFGLFAMRSLGMQLSNLAMIAGGLSVGIGFGMQNIVNNFISGLILIFGRTLQVGDVVEVGGTTGRVRKISVRATMVETYDNAIIFVPNSEFITGKLLNWTSFSRSVRREVEVGVAYGSDTEKVIKLLIGVANAHKNVLKYPVPSVVFANFGDSALDFKLRFWVKDYDMGVSTSSDIRMGINDVFAKENIEISFPQLDVHIKDSPKCQTPGYAILSSPKISPARSKIRPVRPRLTRNPRTADKSTSAAKDSKNIPDASGADESGSPQTVKTESQTS